MKLEDHLRRIRDNYVSFYREKLAELKRDHPSCVTELLIQPNGAQNPAPYSLLRVDAIYGSAPSPSAVRFAFPSHRTAPFLTVEHHGMKIQLGAVSWEHASISFESPRFDLAKLREWLSRWIDDKEEREVDDLGLAGVMHAISWESDGGGHWKITLDFGSAPIACAIELIEALSHQGVVSLILETDEEAA
jgi:hypothetical protein